MNQNNSVLEIIKDVREYLLSLKETGVDEIGVAPALTKEHENPVWVQGGDTEPIMKIPLNPPFSKGEISYPPLEKEGKGGFDSEFSSETPEHKAQRLQLLRDKIGDCRRCKLCSGRTNIVFGTGNPEARLMFVGEGPGREEDRQGKPFVGRAGELLTKMITAMGLSRDNVYIANVIKCRPPDNRNPEDDEIAACKPFLYEQIGLIKPEIVCALGTFAAHTLLDTKTRISDLRGRIHEKGDYKIVATFHPAYLLRNPNEKRRAWEDLQLVMKELGFTKWKSPPSP